MLSDERFAARPHDHPIDVYLGDGAPAKIVEAAQSRGDGRAIAGCDAPGRRIARVDVDADDIASWGRMISKAKRRARELGGDALEYDASYGSALATSGVAFFVVRYEPR